MRLEDWEGRELFIFRRFSLVELAYVAVFCFKYRGWKLIDALQIVVDGFPEQVRCRVLLGLLLGYVIQDLGVRVYGDGEVGVCLGGFEGLGRLGWVCWMLG